MDRDARENEGKMQVYYAAKLEGWKRAAKGLEEMMDERRVGKPPIDFTPKLRDLKRRHRNKNRKKK